MPRLTKLVPFVASYYLDVAANDPKFNTDIAKTDIFTQTIIADPTIIKRGVIHEIGYRINPANAQTYTFMIAEETEAGDYHNNLHILYESPAARADDIDYRITGEHIPFILATCGQFLIATDWTGAAGNCSGYYRIAGVAYL